MSSSIALKPSPTRLDSMLSFRDLEFSNVIVQAYGNRGTPFTKRIPIGMPRIPDRTLNIVGYLYNNVADAESGSDFGGTSFFVAVKSSLPNRSFFYAVTNWHVAVRDGASVLRINTKDGDTEIFDLGSEQWEFDPKYDIAVACIPINHEKHMISALPVPEAIVKMEDVQRVKLGVGEDVFMIGRFVDHDGGPINRPTVRFGNISSMPSPIEQPNAGMADCYCIDLHSRSGYSGSPVFVYRTPGYDLEQMPPQNITDASFLLAGTNYLALLGIHFSQFIELWEIGREQMPKTEGLVPLIRTGQYVKGLSGMTCVLPAWAIWDVLNMPKLKKEREEADARVMKQLISEGKMPPISESAPIPDGNQDHREDFTALLNAAARKPQPKD
jgi:hypothetical protein